MRIWEIEGLDLSTVCQSEVTFLRKLRESVSLLGSHVKQQILARLKKLHRVGSLNYKTSFQIL